MVIDVLQKMINVTEGKNRRLQLDPATSSPLVRRLEATGYLTRDRSSADERTLVIAPTHRGRALRHRAENVPIIMVRRLAPSMEELPALHQLMATFIDAAGAAPDLTGENSPGSPDIALMARARATNGGNSPPPAQR